MIKPLCVAACALPLFLGCAAVPKELDVQGLRVATVHATGFQIYTWDSAWKLKAPDATFTGDIPGKHYAGPTGPIWECTRDGSKVIGHRMRDHASPANAIPWLLLDAKGHDGKGILADVTYIQRLNTTGGTAPAAAGTKAGEEARVPYTADYVFFGPGAAPTVK